MKTIITLDKANQPYGFPQLNGNGNLSNIIVESGLTATTLTMTGLTSNTSDPNLLSIDTNGVVHEYPISSFSGGSVNSVTAGSGLSGNTTTGNITLINTEPDKTVVITGGTNIQIVSDYPNFGINFTGTTSSAFTGGTVSGATNFTNGLTANTISATTYYNLPSTSGAYLPLSGGTVTGATIFQSGLTANTLSATSINRTDFIVFNTGTTSASTVAGTIYFDNVEHALSYNTSINQGVTVNLGQQQYLRVFNDSGTSIQRGKILEILTAYSGLPAVTLAVNKKTSGSIIGVSAEIIPSNTEGIAIISGIISDIAITGASVGSIVYASDTNPGEFVNSTSYLAFPLTARTNQVGYVIQTGVTTGKLYVAISNEPETLSLTDLQRNVLEGNVSSTGVFEFSGGGISLASTSTFNVGSVEGWVVDNTSSPLNPIAIYVKYSGATNIPSLYYSSATETYLLLTSGGTLFQQTTFPTPQERRQNIYLGKMGHGNKTSLNNAYNEPDLDISPLSQLRDMFSPIKLINDNVYPSAYTGLTFSTSSGTLWGLGIGFISNQLNPSSINVSANTITTFQYRTQTGGTFTNRTTIDVGNYDLNGVITAIGLPAKQSTNQRIYLLQNGQFRMQYGEQKYTDLATAIAAVTTETFTTFVNFKDNAILIAILSVRSDATLLTDPLQAKITFASKFGESVGGTGGISTTTLQQAYNNSTNPEIITDAALGAIQVKNGTGNADNVTTIFEAINAAGVSTAFLRADGKISGDTVSTPGFNANSNGLTATTVSATTYYNLNAASGGTYSNGTITLSGIGTLGTITGLGGSGGGQVYYLNLSVAQNGYREFSPIPTTALIQTTGTSIASGVTSTLASFLTPSTYPNTTQLPGGVWTFYIHTYKDVVGASFNAYVQVYKRTSGGTETLLFTTDPYPVTGVSPTPVMEITDAYYSGTTLNTSDRILVVVKGVNTNTATHTLTLATEGSQYYSYATTTFGAGTPNYTTGGTYNNSTGILTFTRTDGNTYTAGTFSYLTAATLSAANVLSVASNGGSPTTTTINAVTGGTYSSGTITLAGTGNFAATITGFSTSTASAFTGGTVSGATNFTGGVTANTLTVSAAIDPVKFVGLQTLTTDTSILSVDNTGVVHKIAYFNGLIWNNSTTATTATTNNGYVGTATTLTTITLPSTAPFGTIVEVVGTGTGLWRISQTGSQIIKFGITGTTAGSSGYLSATSQYDCVKLLCTSADTTFVVTSAIGNIFYN